MEVILTMAAFAAIETIIILNLLDLVGIILPTRKLEERFAESSPTFRAAVLKAQQGSGRNLVEANGIGCSVYCLAVRMALKQANKAYRTLLLCENANTFGLYFPKKEEKAMATMHNAKAALYEHGCTCMAVEIGSRYEQFCSLPKASDVLTAAWQRRA